MITGKQHGTALLDTLSQARTWRRSVADTPRPLGELSFEQLVSVLSFLTDNAATIAHLRTDQLWRHGLSHDPLPLPLAGKEVEWLLATPFVQELTVRIAETARHAHLRRFSVEDHQVANPGRAQVQGCGVS